MILSRTSQYAIQALIFMATQPRGVAVLNHTVAKHIEVPPTYLAEILQSLCKSNLLYSFRGKQGGFCLRKKGKKITYSYSSAGTNYICLWQTHST